MMILLPVFVVVVVDGRGVPRLAVRRRCGFAGSFVVGTPSIGVGRPLLEHDVGAAVVPAVLGLRARRVLEFLDGALDPLLAQHRVLVAVVRRACGRLRDGRHARGVGLVVVVVLGGEPLAAVLEPRGHGVVRAVLGVLAAAPLPVAVVLVDGVPAAAVGLRLRIGGRVGTVHEPHGAWRRRLGQHDGRLVHHGREVPRARRVEVLPGDGGVPLLRVREVEVEEARPLVGCVAEDLSLFRRRQSGPKHAADLARNGHDGRCLCLRLPAHQPLGKFCLRDEVVEQRLVEVAGGGIAAHLGHAVQEHVVRWELLREIEEDRVEVARLQRGVGVAPVQSVHGHEHFEETQPQQAVRAPLATEGAVERVALEEADDAGQALQNTRDAPVLAHALLVLARGDDATPKDTAGEGRDDGGYCQEALTQVHILAAVEGGVLHSVEDDDREVVGAAVVEGEEVVQELAGGLRQRVRERAAQEAEVARGARVAQGHSRVLCHVHGKPVLCPESHCSLRGVGILKAGPQKQQQRFADDAVGPHLTQETVEHLRVPGRLSSCRQRSRGVMRHRLRQNRVNVLRGDMVQRARLERVHGAVHNERRDGVRGLRFAPWRLPEEERRVLRVHGRRVGVAARDVVRHCFGRRGDEAVDVVGDEVGDVRPLRVGEPAL
mmetsp:Transcript_46129/g.142124  ORF Transcript_46129/g.142124 Transcript_46129/m.142124 type:complete len:659 (-) Transcript_46129:181-2157(-)